MSDKCGDCDCASKSQCVKKGNSYVDILETEKSYVGRFCSYVETVVMDIPATENDGKCKCGTSYCCVCGH